ncbi:kinase-like domain-containing protein [Xylariaceae sp. FL1019]|nr:kinase-like domain-containing protein [Xylariaceae sp. FL1019]
MAPNSKSGNWASRRNHGQLYKTLPFEAFEIEDVEEYRPGGFAPVQIGDTLGGGRFEVFRKLGFGGIAIVWLCWEVETAKWRAIKINAANHSQHNRGDLQAMKVWEDHGVDAKQLEENHLFVPLEVFFEDTSNGSHLCTVMPVLGPPLDQWRKHSIREDPDRVNKICYQLVKGLGFMHRHGLCHGDFRPQNILTKLKPNALDLISKDLMATMLDKPRYANLRTTDGQRSPHAPTRVSTAVSGNPFNSVVLDDAVVVDFGEAYSPSEPPSWFGIPQIYQSPEILFNNKSSGFASDVWSLGLTLLELRLDEYPPNSILVNIRNMERLIGPIPQQYRLGAQRKLAEEFGIDLEDGGELFDDQFLMGPVDEPIGAQEKREFRSVQFTDRLEMKIASERRSYGQEWDHEHPDGAKDTLFLIKYFLPRDEVLQLGDLIRRMLKYDPQDRLSVPQVLRHPWFRKHHPRRPIARRKCWLLGYLFVLLISLLFIVHSRSPTKRFPTLGSQPGVGGSSDSVIQLIYLASPQPVSPSIQILGK